MEDKPLFKQPGDPVERETAHPETGILPENTQSLYFIFGWLIFLSITSSIFLIEFWPLTKTPIDIYKEVSSSLTGRINTSLAPSSITKLSSDTSADSLKKNLYSLKQNLIGTLETSRKDSILLLTYDTIGDERRYLWIAIFAGVLGACAHALSSLMDFIGTKRFVKSWMLWYYGLPIVGGIVALVFYVTLKAKILPIEIPTNSHVAYWVAAISFLSGMFTDKATTKLGDVLDSIFTPKNARPDKITNGKIEEKPKEVETPSDIPAVG